MSRGRSRSAPVGGIHPVELAQQRRPFKLAIAALLDPRLLVQHRVGPGFVGQRDLRARKAGHGVADRLLCRMVERAIAAEQVDLDAAGVLQPVHRVEGLRDGAAARKKAVVAQEQNVVGTEVVDDAITLLAADGWSLEVVIGDPAVETHRRLRQWQQAFLQPAYRGAGPRMDVDDALDIRAGLVDRGVQVEARDIDVVAVVRLQQRMPLHVDLHQARGRDLVVQHSVGIDQIGLALPRDARADMVVDQVGHAVRRDQTIACGQIDARLPLLDRHGGLDALERKKSLLAVQLELLRSQ